MNSLSAHLVAGPEHGRLRFHPDCPFCSNQRLAGPLSDAVLPARAQAGLLAAALGAGTLLPTAAAAANAAPDKAPVLGASQTPAPSDDQPVAVDETQEPPVDEAPELRELLTDPDIGTDSAGEDVGADEEASDPAPAEPLAEQPAEPAPVAPAPATEPVTPAPAPLEPAPAPVEAPPTAGVDQSTPPEAPTGKTKRSSPKRSDKLRQRGTRQHATTADPAPQSVTPAPVVEAAGPTARVQAVPISQPAPPAEGPITGASYTVQPGDSLWSIARRLLSTGASNGRIAREVNRLWRLNAERIGTGDPSLLHIGTPLRLR